MNLTIYIDVLFLLNLIINYIILCSAAFVTAPRMHKLRIISAAAFGALYNVIIFFPQFELLNLVIFKLAAGVILLLIAFRYTGILNYIKSLVAYFIINAVYGGGMYAFYRFTSIGSKMNFSNGVYYIDLPLWAVILLAFVFYYLIRVFAKISESRERYSNITEVKVEFNGVSANAKALIDTGNSLCDPISLMPVMLTESAVFKDKLSSLFLSKAAEGKAESLPVMHKAYPELKIRMIPFQDIGGNKKIIYAFKPQKITDIKNNREIPNTLIGIIGTKLAEDGSYNALLHSKF